MSDFRLSHFLCATGANLLFVAAGFAWDDPQELFWNQWRGANRDGLSTDTGLLKEWPEGGPPLAWKRRDVGEGYSSVSFSGMTAFTMGDVDGSSKIIALA